MPFASIKFKPGINAEPTPTLNEAGLSASNLIRFRDGMVEKLGGWAKYTATAMNSAVRALNAWQDLYGNDRLGVGCVGDLGYVQNNTPSIPANAAFSSICPLIDDEYLTIGTATVSTQGTPTTPSTTVTIVDPNRNMSIYDVLYIKTPISVGGIVLSGTYAITSQSGASTFTIQAATASTVTVTGNNLGTNIYVPQFTVSVATGAFVTVDFPNHGVVVGQTVTFLTPTTLAGITIYGDYVVTQVVTANQYKFQANATPTGSATQYMGYPTQTGKLHFYYYVAYGPAASGGGYGAGPFGVGAYGIGAASANFLGTGSVNGTTLTISSVTFGSVSIGTTIVGPGIATGTIITALSPTPPYTGTGGVGTYQVSPATSPASGTVTIYGTTLHTGTTIVQSTWSLDNWGRDLIAVPYGGPVYIWDPQSGYQTATVIPEAPQANTGAFIAMPQRQIVCYGSSFTGIADPLLIRWCDAADYTVWNATSQNQAGSFRIPTGSKIVGAIQAAQQAFIWTDVDVWSMQYIQPPLIYGFTKISTNCGLIAQKAVGTLGPNTFWMSQRQFFVMNPAGLEVLPCSVWDFVFQNLKQGLVSDTSAADYGQPYTNRITCATNTQYNEVVWYFPSNESSTGENDSYVKFNIVEKVWDYGKLSRTAWIDQSILGSAIGGGRTDAGIYYIYQHEYDSAGAPLYDADGAAMNSMFATGYASISNGTDFTFVDYMVPDMKWGAYRTLYVPSGVSSTLDTIYNTSTNPATVSITAYVTNYPGDAPNTYSYTMTQGQTSLPSVRFRGRQVAFSFSSSDVGTWWRVGNVKYRAAVDGRR